MQASTGTRKDDTDYKGLLHLDQQHMEHQIPTLEGLQKYSAAFGYNEDDPSDIPPPPRVSPDPGSPRANTPECLDSDEESFSEDDQNEELINKSSETRSLSSAGCRSLVFAIPTAGSEGGSDEETSVSDFKPGRVSADYVVKSEGLLDELNEKNQTEAAEISDMLQDMENAKVKISNLRISPRDLEVESTSSQSSNGDISPDPGVTGTSTPSVHVVNMQMECPPVDDFTGPADGLYETFWVEEPVETYMPNVLPLRNSRVCSARYMSQHAKDSARVRKHQSESSLVLKGKTMEFVNSEDLAARNRLQNLRRTSDPNNSLNRSGFTEEGSSLTETNLSRNKKVATKPPLPKWSPTKSNKKQASKQKLQSGGKTSKRDQPPAKSSLRKSNSDGNIHLSVMGNEDTSGSSSLKKSVTFSQDVFSHDSEDLDCSKAVSSLVPREQSSNDVIDDETGAKRTLESCLWSHPGVVIKNGFEIEEKDSQTQESPELAGNNQFSSVSNLHRKTQSTRAKLLAKVKEIPCEEEPCACRSVTRPTAAVLAESKNRKTGTKQTSSGSEKLLKSRPTRPSSAPIKRTPERSESTAERPKSPRRKPRATSATVRRERTVSEGAHGRPRPSSAHVGRLSSKDARRSRAAAKVLKEGFLFKERPPPPLPPGSKERQQKREENGTVKEQNNNSATLSWNKDEDEVVASEECHEVFARLQEKGIDVSMDTIKRGLMAPARKANDYSLAAMGSSSGLLSRPENWLPEEHARVQIWENVLSKYENEAC